MRFNEQKQKFEAYASVEEVLEVKTSSTRLDLSLDAEGQNLAKFAAAKTEGEIQDGYLYVRARAISSRVNKNNDGWPSEELIRAYRTFVGRPVFVDHNNSDPQRTRGVIVDSRLHVEDDEAKESALDPYYASAPDNHKPPTWIEILIEVDAETFPKLAKAVKKGDIDSVSMGANIDKSVCSVCHNEATIPSDYCSHVKQKGLTFEITADNGEKIQKKAYEDCYGVNFFEISFVFDPADETALNIETAEHELKLAASTVKEAIGIGDSAFLLKQKGDYTEWPDESRARTRSIVQQRSPEMANHLQEVEDVISGLRSGDMNTALRAANILSANGFPQNPWLGMNAQDIVDRISSNLVTAKTADVADPSEERELNYEPQDDKVKAPEKVDTLRDDIECPNCGVDSLKTDPDGVLRCPTCQYEQPPEGLDDPDLSKAQDQDDSDRFNEGKDDKVDNDPDDDAIAKIVEKGDRKGGDSDPFISPIEPVRSSSTRKDIVTKGLINEMNWKQLVATNNVKEANASLRQVTGASVETTIEHTGGIHFGTHSAMRSAGLSCTVQFPGASQPAPIPGNPMMTFMFQQQAMEQLGVSNPGELPITVTAPDDQLDAALRVIHSGGDGPPGAGGPTAATKGKDKKPVVPGDKRSGDEPKGEKIVSDQIEPVTADRRVIKREESPDGHRTEHIVEETGELLEEEDKPKDEKKDSDAKETEDGNEAKPQAEREKDENDNRPDFLKNKDKQPAFASAEDKQGKLLAALAVADEAIEMGVIDKNKRLAFLGQLEEETISEIEARRRTLALVKSAGLTNRRIGSRRTVLPRLSSNAAPSNGSVNLDDIPFEAIFTDGIQ